VREGGALSRADAILDAFAARRLMRLLSDDDSELDEGSAYSLAGDIHARRVERGENPVGRKIGFTNRGVWHDYEAPIWGHVYDSTVRYAPSASAHVSVVDLLQPRIEPEIVLHLARRPTVTRDEAAILDCLDWIAHGFELVQSPYPGWKFRRVDAIAAFGLHGSLVVGTPVLVSEIDDCPARLRGFTITLFKDGEEQASGRGTNVLGSPLLAFAHLTEILSMQRGAERLQAGEIVTTGTLTKALPITSGETWHTTLDGIALPGLSITVE
jgi:2-oxo-3-hexenedioate decarboxylase